MHKRKIKRTNEHKGGQTVENILLEPEKLERIERKLDYLIGKLEQIEKPTEIYTINKATKELNIGRSALEKGVKSGALKHVKVGATTYISAKAIDKFLESNNELI